MLRSKGLSEKVIVLGIDGMDPRFSRKLVDEGKMPNLAKLIERGSARHDLRLLGANPTITPPMWTTLATGAYPMTHGIEDFNINVKGELDINFGGIYSKYCHAEQIWNVTAEAGKKTLVWHWPGSAWPPSSDSENLLVVDGTSPGSLGQGYAMRDWEGVLVASGKVPENKYYYGATTTTEGFSGDPADFKKPAQKQFTRQQPKQPYWDEVWEEFKDGIEGFNGFHMSAGSDMRTNILMPNDSQMTGLHCYPQSVSLSQIVEPEGWACEVPEGAKEITWMQVFGHMPHPCLMLKNEQGVYDKLAIYASKQAPAPLATIEKDVYTPNVPDFVPMREGGMENVVRNMRILEMAEDGSYLRMWYSLAFSVDDKCAWYPTWIHDEIFEKFGPACPTGMMGDGDLKIMNGCNLVQWRQAAKWQADALNYMISEHGVECIFSHFHGPDMSGHTYMRTLKERPDSNLTEEQVYECAIGTYQMTDEYIGEFLHLLDEGWSIILVSDHSLVAPESDYVVQMGDNYGINTGVLYDLGYTVLKKDENGELLPEFDWEKTRAIQQRSNSIFINLKGRDRHGIVDPADKYELEEQIITDLYGLKDPTTGHRVVALALHAKDAVLLGLGGDETAGDIIFFLDENVARDHGEGLSTACGHADTTLSPIFVAAGAGVKEGFEMKLFPREVDVAPTVATLLGLRFPAETEGAPAYTILTEEL